MTRIEAGTFAIRRTRFHLAPLLDETCEQFEVAAREHEITLSRDVAPDVPMVVGDRDRLGQVLSNLVSNALKFTPPQGRVSVRARVRSLLAGGSHIIGRRRARPADRQRHRRSARWQHLGRKRAGSRHHVSLYSAGAATVITAKLVFALVGNAACLA